MASVSGISSYLSNPKQVCGEADSMPPRTCLPQPSFPGACPLLSQDCCWSGPLWEQPQPSCTVPVGLEVGRLPEPTVVSIVTFFADVHLG